MHDLETFEDRKLVLSTLLLPWLGEVTSEALVATSIPTDALRYIKSACRHSLGLPPNAPLELHPPSMHEAVHTIQTTCGHRFSLLETAHELSAVKPHPTTRTDGGGVAESQEEDLGSPNDQSAALGTSNSSSGSAEAEFARPYLPLGLAWAGDCASFASERNRVTASCMRSMNDGRRGYKRTRSAHEDLEGAHILVFCAWLP